MNAPKKITEQNVAFLGDVAVGKTSLINALVGGTFNQTQTVTQGLKEYGIDGATGAKFIDFGGQQIYRGEVDQALRTLDLAAVIIVENPREMYSSSKIDSWLDLLDKNVKNPDLPKILVISHCDQFQDNSIDQIADRQRFSSIHRTSALDSTGIQELRSAIRDSIIEVEDPEDLGEVVDVVRVLSECLCELVAKNAKVLYEIEWRDLERLLARALETLGFSVKLTPSAKDGGKDIILDCVVLGKKKRYYVEVKHWRSGGRPGKKELSDFVEVNAREATDGGLFVSSSGFTDAVFARLGELSSQKIRVGAEQKIVSLCQNYVRKKNGCWHCNSPLPDILFENTLS